MREQDNVVSPQRLQKKFTSSRPRPKVSEIVPHHSDESNMMYLRIVSILQNIDTFDGG
jgi:hypothetical protein